MIENVRRVDRAPRAVDPQDHRLDLLVLRRLGQVFLESRQHVGLRDQPVLILGADDAGQIEQQDLSISGAGQLHFLDRSCRLQKIDRNAARQKTARTEERESNEQPLNLIHSISP